MIDHRFTLSVFTFTIVHNSVYVPVSCDRDVDDALRRLEVLVEEATSADRGKLAGS